MVIAHLLGHEAAAVAVAGDNDVQALKRRGRGHTHHVDVAFTQGGTTGATAQHAMVVGGVADDGVEVIGVTLDEVLQVVAGIQRPIDIETALQVMTVAALLVVGSMEVETLGIVIGGPEYLDILLSLGLG